MVPRELKFNVLDDGRQIMHVHYDPKEDSFKNDVKDKRFSWLLEETGNWNTLYFFLESRVFPKRKNYQKDLDMIGLKKYDVLEILRITKGALCSDDLTLEFIE